jgi:hypothetical protein
MLSFGIASQTATTFKPVSGLGRLHDYPSLPLCRCGLPLDVHVAVHRLGQLRVASLFREARLQPDSPFRFHKVRLR